MDSSDTVHQAEAFVKRLQGLLLRRSALGNKGCSRMYFATPPMGKGEGNVYDTGM